MGRTEQAVAKLNILQRGSLDNYKALAQKNYRKGDDEKYRNRIRGYVTALEDSGVITITDARCLRTYFTL